MPCDMAALYWRSSLFVVVRYLNIIVSLKKAQKNFKKTY